MSTITDAWGPYRSTIDKHLGDCEDLLARLRRSFAGEVAADRCYFADKAHDLRDAAQALVDEADDVEWWVGACSVEISRDGLRCGRSRGHPGRHLPDDQCRERLVLVGIRLLAAEIRSRADRFAWSLLGVRAQAAIPDRSGAPEES